VTDERLLRPCSILVVEDHRDLRDLLCEFMRREGFWVTGAANGADALDVMDWASFDVIILDLHMPVMDGRAFLTELRERPEPHPVVILISSDEDGAQTARHFCAAAFLHKSFSVIDLLATIERICPAAAPIT
jgi:CheY-like chemotaxis protein